MSSQQNIALIPRGLFGVIGLTFRLFFGRFGKVLGIAVLVLLPLLAFSALGQLANVAFAGMRGATDASSMAAGLSIGAICLGILTLVLGACYPLMEGALTHNVIERVLGRDPGVGASYSAARPQWGALWISNAVRQIVIYLAMATAGVVVGMIVSPRTVSAVLSGAQNTEFSGTLSIIVLALCGPLALIVLAAAALIAINWSLRAPAIIGEGSSGFEALGRSNSLVSGNRWRMGIRLLPLALIELLTVSFPAALITSITSGQTFQQIGETAVEGLLPVAGGAAILSALISLFAKPWQIIYMAVNYLDLRARKEDLAAIVGASAEQTTVIVQPTQVAAPEPDSAFSPQQPVGVRIGALTRRLRLEPNNAQLTRQLAEASESVGDVGGAIAAWTRVRELEPSNAAPLLRLARLQLNRRDREAAARYVAEYSRAETDASRLDDLRNDSALSSLLPQS